DGGRISYLSAESRASLPGTTTTLATSVLESRGQIAASAPSSALANGLQGASFVTGDPIGADVAAVESGNANVASGIGAGSNVFALMTLGVGAAQNASGAAAAYTSSGRVNVWLGDATQAPSLRLGLVNAVATGSGFDTLQLTITNKFVVIFTETFSDLDAALAFFSDHVLELGVLQPDRLGFFSADLEVKIAATTSSAGDSFRVEVVAAAVPEPSTYALLVLGLATAAATAWRRRTARSV
ncbi:MAG TPA: PEP-CTERM sorting domain-containing protein, partial [Chthoniobacterales bacterium]